MRTEIHTCSYCIATCTCSLLLFFHSPTLYVEFNSGFYLPTIRTCKCTCMCAMSVLMHVCVFMCAVHTYVHMCSEYVLCEYVRQKNVSEVARRVE